MAKQEQEKKDNKTVNLLEVTKKQESDVKCTGLEAKIHEVIGAYTTEVKGMTVSEIQKALIRAQYYYNNTALEHQYAQKEQGK